MSQASSSSGSNSPDGFEEALRQTGIDFNKSTAEIAAYVHERAIQLSLIGPGDPGFSKALAAEAKNCASFAADAVVDRSDEIDQKILAVIIGGLGMAVTA